jgi:hypothetical protein
MAWSGIKSEGETINDGGRKLRIGTFPYSITGANMAVVKSDPTGKTQQVVIDLLNGDSYACKAYFSVMAENEQQREIAEKGIRAFAQAAGFKGIIKPETLKKLVGAEVLVTAVETPNKKGGAPYINIQSVEAYEGGEEEEVEEEEEEEAPAPPVKKGKKLASVPEPEEEEEEETEEEDEEEEDPAPPVKKGKKSTPW